VVLLAEVTMDDKITIIEGPPPIFEPVNDAWALGLFESASNSGLTITRLRTYHGAELVERCHRVWDTHDFCWLHYRNEMGLEEQTPIMAARSVDTSDGQVLFLWVRHHPNLPPPPDLRE
jgi:hypothetical protein